MYMCTYIHIYIYTCVHTHICGCVCVCSHVYTLCREVFHYVVKYSNSPFQTSKRDSIFSCADPTGKHADSCHQYLCPYFFWRTNPIQLISLVYSLDDKPEMKKNHAISAARPGVRLYGGSSSERPTTISYNSWMHSSLIFESLFCLSRVRGSCYDLRSSLYDALKIWSSTRESLARARVSHT